MNEAIQQEKRRVAILGSTGSIGTQALEVIREQADYLEVEVLTAHNNVDLLIEQSIAFQPNAVVIGNPAHYDKLKEALAPYPVKVYAGEKALCQIVEMDSIDIVLTAMVGFAGLRPTIHAIEAGKPIALANKETLVVAGAYITRLARERGVNIYPVDS
jgi:1-deoxy-D-xylulose-5-phosphate reductoisomerase